MDKEIEAIHDNLNNIRDAVDEQMEALKALGEKLGTSSKKVPDENTPRGTRVLASLQNRGIMNKTIIIGETELIVYYECTKEDLTCEPPIEEDLDITNVHAYDMGDVVELCVKLWEPHEDEIKEELKK